MTYSLTDNTTPADNNPRRRWMGLLARADGEKVTSAWGELGTFPDYIIIKQPEQGLVMVRGRAGGSGHPFNLGEMTVTRCSVRLENGTIGHAYVQGRQSDYSEKAAVIDALMQSDEYHNLLEEKLISKLEKLETERRRKKSKKAAATKVDFFTMVRGED